MKEGWEIKKLGDVCDIEHGYAFEGTNFETDYYGDKPIVLTPGNFSENATLVFNERNTKRCSVVYPKEYEFNIGDLVVVMTDLSSKMKILGKPAIIESENILHNQRIGRFVFHDDSVYKNYLFYLLQTDAYLNAIKDSATGTMVRHTAPKRILNFDFPLPPLPEQHRIVSILDEAFAAIAKAKANAEQNLKNAKELFESYLQGVFENGDWERKTIEVVCDEIFAGGDAPKNNYSLEPNENHNIPIYANAEKNRGLYGYTDFARVSKACVTIAARGSGTGHTELRNESFLPIVRLIVCIPDSKQISTEFLKYTIDNLVIQRSGSAIPQLTVPMIKDYLIPVPPVAEQKEIIEKAENLRAETQKLEALYQKKIADLEELKKSILQKAFSGELTGREVGV